MPKREKQNLIALEEKREFELAVLWEQTELLAHIWPDEACPEYCDGFVVGKCAPESECKKRLLLTSRQQAELNVRARA